MTYLFKTAQQNRTAIWTFVKVFDLHNLIKNQTLDFSFGVWCGVFWKHRFEDIVLWAASKATETTWQRTASLHKVLGFTITQTSDCVADLCSGCCSCLSLRINELITWANSQQEAVLCDRRRLHVWPHPSTKVAEGGRSFRLLSPSCCFSISHTGSNCPKKEGCYPRRKVSATFRLFSHCNLKQALPYAASRSLILLYTSQHCSSSCFFLFLVYLSSSLTSHLFAFSFGVYHGLTFTPDRVFYIFSFLSFVFNSFPQLVMSLIWCPISQTLAGVWWTSEVLRG